MPVHLTEPAGVRKSKATPPASSKNRPRLRESPKNAPEAQSLQGQEEEKEPADADMVSSPPSLVSNASETETEAETEAETTTRPEHDIAGRMTWVEIETILERMYLTMSRTDLDLDSVAAALREMRRLQARLQVAIQEHVDYHHG